MRKFPLIIAFCILVGAVFAAEYIPEGNTPQNEEISQYTASVLLEKNTYLMHETVLIQGESFKPLTNVLITIQRPTTCGNDTCLIETISNISTDAEGQFETTYEIQNAWGKYNLSITDGVQLSVANFTVIPCRVLTDRWEYHENDTVIITGMGYDPNSPLNVTLLLPDNSTESWWVNTDQYGNFSTDYYLATGLPGHYLVAATDGKRSALTIFIDPAIFLFPSSGPIGTTVTVQADGFWGSGNGEEWGGGIYFGGDLVAEINNVDGTFITTFEVPEVLWAGDYTVFAQSRAWFDFTYCRYDCIAWGWEGCCTVEVDGTCAVWWPFCEWVCVETQLDCSPGWRYYSASATFTVTENDPPTTQAQVDGTMGDNDWYISDVEVTLSAQDDGAVMETLYSYDGTNWMTYQDPVQITDEGITDFYYRSIDTEGNKELIQLLTLKIDKTQPTTNIDLGGTFAPSGWWLSNVLITLTGQDPHSDILRTEYSTDLMQWSTYIDPILLQTQGITTIYYRSIDNAGNTEQTKSQTIALDKTPPTSNINYLPAYIEAHGDTFVLNNTPFTIEAIDDISGVACIYYRLNQSNWMIYDNEFNLTGPMGFYRIEYYSVDIAGNTEDPKSFQVILGEIYNGKGLLYVDGEIYCGNTTMILYPNTIQIILGEFSETWMITKHYTCHNIDFYFGEGRFGKLMFIIFHFVHSTQIFAFGEDDFFWRLVDPKPYTPVHGYKCVE